MACGILAPQPGIEPAFPALEAWSLNHWTAREVSPYIVILDHSLKAGSIRNNDFELKINRGIQRMEI